MKKILFTIMMLLGAMGANAQFTVYQPAEVPHSNTFHTSIKVFRNFFFPESCFFQKHYLSLQCPSKIEAQKAKVSGRGTYILKAFSERFGFDALRTSQLPIVCQKQSNGNAP